MSQNGKNYLKNLAALAESYLNVCHHFGALRMYQRVKIENP